MPYRGDLESQLEAAKSEITSLQNKLSDANKQLKRNDIMNKFTDYGIFAILIVMGVFVFGILGTFCLCLSNNCSVLAAFGGSCIVAAVIIIFSSLYIGLSWNSLFRS